MRALLASPVEEVTPATTLTAFVLVVASVVVLLPALIICGICEESRPAAPPSRAAGNHHGGSGQQVTASSSIPVAVAPPATAAGPTLHETEASAFDQQPRQTGMRGFSIFSQCSFALVWFCLSHSNARVAQGKWMFATIAFTSSWVQGCESSADAHCRKKIARSESLLFVCSSSAASGQLPTSDRACFESDLGCYEGCHQAGKKDRQIICQVGCHNWKFYDVSISFFLSSFSGYHMAVFLVLCQAPCQDIFSKMPMNFPHAY